MGWFSFLGSKQKEGATPAIVAAPSKTQGMLWLETASEEIYQQTLTNMWNEVKALNGFPSKTHASNASIYAGLILKKIQKLDRNRLSLEQKRNLAGIVFATFPRAVAKMETQLGDLDERHWASEEFGETLRALATKYIDLMPRKIPIPNQLTSVSTETAQKAVETVGSNEADQKLAAVKELAAEAYKLATSVEDRFFAEQAANSYIPDSVRMLAGLIHAPEDMKDEANELFLKQLEILESQLRGVIGRSAMNSLSAMKAHTEFLESKKEVPNERLDLS